MVDGLDEAVDETDGHLGTAEFFKRITASKDTRARWCLACRTYVEFRHESKGFATLKVEDYTKPDILRFATGELSEFNDRGGLNEDIAETVALKANGVFLWVSVVTKKLLTSHRRASDDLFLHHLLQVPPEEIDVLYERLLINLDYRDQEEASRFLLLLRCSFTPCVPVEVLQYTLQFSFRSSRTWRSLKDRIEVICLGFLEVVNGTVQFCHETVATNVDHSEVIRQALPSFIHSPVILGNTW